MTVLSTAPALAGGRGEAIYGTRRWNRDFYKEAFVRYTAKGDDLYAICVQWPGRENLY